MKRIARVLLLCIIFLTAGCGGNLLESMSAASYYQKGAESYEAGDYETALEYFATAVDKGLPEELVVYAHSYMGHCHLERENYEAAETWYQSALATGREAAMCHTNLGVYYRRREFYEEAERHYLEALNANASYTPALASLGVLYSVNGRADEAVPLLEQAVSLESEAPAVYHANLAYAYAETGAFSEARAQLETAERKGYSGEGAALILMQIEEREGSVAPTEVPVPTSTPTVTPMPTSTPVPTEAPVPTSTPTPALTTGEVPIAVGKTVAIDPGHQSKGNYEKEPVGPGATELKTKVSSGTQGATTKVPEHRFNLEVSLKLRDALEELGYHVVMTRETAEVNISNAERAQLANEAEADIFLRIHADGAENTAANGISVLYPSENNPYVAALSTESKRLAQSILDGMCDATGAKKRGIIKRDDLTGTNWAEMPVVVIEAGFMTNAEEEQKLVSAEYQALLVQGIVDGIQAYFEE